MKPLTLLAIFFIGFHLYADKDDPLYLDTNMDLKFSLQEQQAWTEQAIMEYQKLKSNASLKVKKRLKLIISSDMNEDGSIDQTEKRLIRGRLASICRHYESIFEKHFTDGAISSSYLKRIQKQYPTMIPCLDLEDPFTEKVKIKQELSPVYF